MLSGLPRLLGRGFLIGFVLPATLFLLALKVIDEAFSLDLLTTQKGADVLGIIIVPFTIMFLSILLLAVNRPIIRTLEGYGSWNPLRWLFLKRTIRRFQTEIKPVLDERDRLDKERKTDPNARSIMPHFSKRLHDAIMYYPDKADFVLATSFGNVMRAFEVYSRVVYGLEAIQAWNRIELLLPSKVRDQIKDSRAMVDFIANILALAIATFAIYLTVAIREHKISSLVMPITTVATAGLAWSYLPTAALQWGETVKSVFDLYRGRLARSLGLELPADPADEVNMWRQVSLMMTYRSHGAFTTLRHQRKVKRRSRRKSRGGSGEGGQGGGGTSAPTG